MNVAIIGTGNVGRALAGSLTRAGHSVTLSSRDPDELATVARETGARAAASNVEAASGADVIILAVWFANLEEVAREIADVARGKTIVELSNPLNPTYDGLVTEGGPSAAERVQQWMPGANVVKAFNTIFASRQTNPTAEGTELDAFVAGDDPGATAAVRELARSMGMRPVDAGPLKAAGILEGMAFLNISLNARLGLDWQSYWKLEGVAAGTKLEREAAGVGAGR